MVILVARSEQGPQGYAAAGGNQFPGAQLDHAARSQPLGQRRFQLGVAAHRTIKDVLQPVQAADVVAVAVGNQDGRHPGPAQLLIVVQYLAGPGAIRLPGVHQDHVVGRVADKVNLCAAGVHCAKGALVFPYMGTVNMLGNLHRESSW